MHTEGILLQTRGVLKLKTSYCWNLTHMRLAGEKYHWSYKELFSCSDVRILAKSVKTFRICHIKHTPWGKNQIKLQHNFRHKPRYDLLKGKQGVALEKYYKVFKDTLPPRVM